MENFSALEKRLWDAADELRANSKLTSSEYCMPVLGLIFLRHAYNRFLAVKPEIVAKLPKRGGVARALNKDDFAKKRALFLQPTAQFDYILALPKDRDRGQAIIDAMDSIERDYDSLAGVLPKDYQIFEPGTLDRLLRIFDDAALRSASGDVFGRIYEYFLMKFAMEGAQDKGEFFTPPSLVQTIVNVIEPDHGKVCDPACGSAGMFVQTSHFIEEHGHDTMRAVTFYGQEKTATTIRLAKMNLAVHGLSGEIAEGNSFYEDLHEMLGKADFVMANPPFNVDAVDASKITKDPRLPFGLPGVNNKGAVSNGNYLWISYFYSYLSPTGRAGFVMSSQASSAGNKEAEVRRQLVQTGHVDAMISIRSGFFYTRTVPCELWFLDKGKPADRLDQVLMLDARSIGQLMRGSRKVYDFTPEQLKNLTAIVWLFRGERTRFIGLLLAYRGECALRLAQFHHALAPLRAGEGCVKADVNFLFACIHKAHGMYLAPDAPVEKKDALSAAHDRLVEQFVALLPDAASLADSLEAHRASFEDDAGSAEHGDDYALGRVQAIASRLDALTQETHRVIRAMEAFWKELDAALDLADELLSPDFRKSWRKESAVRDKQKSIAPTFTEAPRCEGELRYFHRQLHWLLHRFPEARFVDVPGLVKAVARREIEAADWSLTPGRYVGVAEGGDEDEEIFEERLAAIHAEISTLDAEAVDLAASIEKRFTELLA